MAKQSGGHAPGSLVLAAVTFEFALGGIGVLLGWFCGVDPFAHLAWRNPLRLLFHLACGTAATLPMLGLLLWIRRSRFRGFRALRELLHEQLVPHFADANAFEVAWVSLAAGLGEELLFRGFLLEAFSKFVDPQTFGGWLPLLLSSLLFGLAHAVSWTYLGLATGVGLYLGILLTISGSLWVPVTTHAVYDFVALRCLQHDHDKMKRAT